MIGYVMQCYTRLDMAKHTAEVREQTGFRIRPDLLARMRALKEREGIPLSFQIESALERWLDARDRKEAKK